MYDELIDIPAFLLDFQKILHGVSMTLVRVTQMVRPRKVSIDQHERTPMLIRF
ncbi:hypothetical protein TR2A62_1797 [Thalassobium sp. R2A62]|nr:hypothetical protein TR2A62_1797 [Thalassobium sp. R2A62]